MSKREGGIEGEGDRSGVYGDTAVYISLYRPFPVSKWGGREGEGEASGVCGDTDVYTTLYGSFPVSKRVINLVFYAQSTSTVISGRERERGREGGKAKNIRCLW